MADWDDLGAYVDAQAADSAFVQECWAEATALITTEIGEAEVPTVVLRRATIEVGADLYYRRGVRNGIVGINNLDVTPVRINRDPMAAGRPILASYLAAGFA